MTSETSTIVAMPLRGPARRDALLQIVRRLDAANMTTPELVTAIEAEIPDATPDEMVAALRTVGDEQKREAEEMRALRQHLAPVWSKNPEMTLEQAIDAMAEQGDPKCIAWRDHMRRRGYVPTPAA